MERPSFAAGCQTWRLAVRRCKSVRNSSWVARRLRLPVMRALILTNEFPPHVYGGAGVHVDYLTRELRKLIEVEVRSFAGAPTDVKGWRVRAYEPAHSPAGADAKLQGLWATLSRDIGFVADPIT